MGRVLGIVYRVIATHLTHKAGYIITTAHTGAVTLIQRFGSALNLNIQVLESLTRTLTLYSLSRCATKH